jgi:two-component system, NtrC family, response regulator AtoC
MASSSPSPYRSRTETDSPSPASEGCSHVLVIEHDASLLSFIRQMLERDKYLVTACTTLQDAVSRFPRSPRPDVIVFDENMPIEGSRTTLHQVREALPDAPILLLSCASDPRAVITAVKSGAKEFLLKPFGTHDLRAAISRCIQLNSKTNANGRTQSHEIDLGDNQSFVFGSKAMLEIRAQCSLVARVDLPVLILGESGTGKEVLSQYIHKMSPRAHRTFMKINCAAMPADLLESELFGYEQGAFTGATKAKPGKFEICNRGTILLDEIGEMPPTLQAKLLQVLQDGSFSRLGGRSTVKVDVRVIAATNIDIQAAIANKSFREDLFYRLNGFTMHLPALRDRKEEIPALLRYFIRKLGNKYGTGSLVASEELIEACMKYSWPGNLREVENFVKRLLVLGDEELMIAELSVGQSGPTTISNGGSGSADAQGGLKKLVSGLKGEAEMEAIAIALNKSGWNRKQAAIELQISYKALLYKIRQYGIEPPNPSTKQVGN